jgi:HPt (histidine-containing phosphotransfer) domain-containing protein
MAPRDTSKKTDRKTDIAIERFADHVVIRQPNRLRRAFRRVPDDYIDDAVARAEAALASLSGEFRSWMQVECERLAAAYAAIERNGLSRETIDELFRAAHDIKGGAATFGYPVAADTARSLCRIIEHAPDLAKVPDGLIGHHVDAIIAFVRENAAMRKPGMAEELSVKLRRLADDYLTLANHDRPEHLEAVLAPSIVPE